jgi:hypothetical protein
VPQAGLAAGDAAPCLPSGRSISSATLRPIRSCRWARRMDRRRVLLTMTMERLVRFGELAKERSQVGAG